MADVCRPQIDDSIWFSGDVSESAKVTDQSADRQQASNDAYYEVKCASTAHYLRRCYSRELCDSILRCAHFCWDFVSKSAQLLAL